MKHYVYKQNPDTLTWIRTVEEIKEPEPIESIYHKMLMYHLYKDL